MRTLTRAGLALFFLLTGASVWVYTQTANTLVKYGSGGSLTSSSLYDNAGSVTWGPSGSEAGRITYNSQYFYVEARNSRALNLSGDRMVVLDNGNVGVARPSPSHKLDVGAASNSVGLRVIDGNNIFTVLGTGGSDYGVIGWGANGVAKPLRFQAFSTLGANSGTDVMTILGNGNVGIGTTSPSAKLHVSGNVTVTGNIAAKYQDVAEWVEADTQLAPGTVVIADPDGRDRVRASTAAYDTAVAGVVSAQPGVLLGEKGAGKIAVAQSGRVRVKADASFGAIRPGDLLVTSSVEGYAMRSTPVSLAGTEIHRPGTILGKALEPLSTGKGDVLVLVTLQ